MNNMSLKEMIGKAKEIKKQGGIGRIQMGLSSCPEDYINKSIRESNRLLEKLK